MSLSPYKRHRFAVDLREDEAVAFESDHGEQRIARHENGIGDLFDGGSGSELNIGDSRLLG